LKSAPATPPASQAAPIPRPVAAPVQTTPPAVRDRLVRSVEPLPPQRRGLWIGGGIAVLLILILLWGKFHSTPSTVTAPTVAAPAAKVAAPAPDAARIAKPSAASPVNSGRPTTAATNPARPSPSDSKTQWRVVSYTYNRQDQAQKKADTIASQHAALHPEVFTATGHAPYLVTLGGPMTREQALAVRDQARAAGLAPDTYIQNYSR
jgi:hypothetical protein